MILFWSIDASDPPALLESESKKTDWVPFFILLQRLLFNFNLRLATLAPVAYHFKRET